MRFLLKEYASEAVAFDTASGDTHYLAPLALAAFKLFAEQPALSLEAARDALLRQPLAGQTPTPVAVDETLDGLRRVGLVCAE